MTPKLVLDGEVVRVIDGDTVEVELKLHCNVRLMDCWAPERHSDAGKASAAYLAEQSLGRPCQVEIPLDTADNLSDLFSFGRVLGNIYVTDESLAETQVASGYATRTKEG